MFLQAWTANLSDKEAEELVSKLKMAEEVFDRLSFILDQRMKSSIDEQHSSKRYESPNWALFQADAIGYQRALKMVKDLISER